MKSNPAMAVYLAAEKRLKNALVPAIKDEVIVALWVQVREQARKLREQSHQIEILQMKQNATVGVSAEYDAMIARMSNESHKQL